MSHFIRWKRGLGRVLAAHAATTSRAGRAANNRRVERQLLRREDRQPSFAADGLRQSTPSAGFGLAEAGRVRSMLSGQAICPSAMSPRLTSCSVLRATKVLRAKPGANISRS